MTNKLSPAERQQIIDCSRSACSRMVVDGMCKLAYGNYNGATSVLLMIRGERAKRELHEASRKEMVVA